MDERRLADIASGAIPTADGVQAAAKRLWAILTGGAEPTDIYEWGAAVRAGITPKLSLENPYGQQMYQNTKTYPEVWRRNVFGDDIIDAEQAAREAAADKQRADELQGQVEGLEDENRRLRLALARRHHASSRRVRSDKGGTHKKHNQ